MNYNYEEEIKKLMEVLPDLTSEEIKQGIVKIQDEEGIDQYPALLKYRSVMQGRMTVGMTEYFGRVLLKSDIKTPKENDMQTVFAYIMDDEGAYHFVGATLWDSPIADDIHSEDVGLALQEGNTFSLMAKLRPDRFLGQKLQSIRDVVNTGNDDTIPEIWDLELLPLGNIYDCIGNYDMFEGMVVNLIYGSEDKTPSNITGFELSHTSNPVPIRCMFKNQYGNMSEENVKYVQDNLKPYTTIRAFGKVSGDAKTKDATIWTDAVFFQPEPEDTE